MSKNRVITKEAILAVARRMFNEYGYEGTDMRQIAVECNVAVGTLYNSYDTKYDIFNAVYRAELQATLQKIDQVIARDLPARERLHLVIEQIYSDTNAHITVWINKYALDLSTRYLSGKEKQANNSQSIGLDPLLVQKIERLIEEIYPRVIDPQYATLLARTLLDAVSVGFYGTSIIHEHNVAYLRWLVDHLTNESS